MEREHVMILVGIAVIIALIVWQQKKQTFRKGRVPRVPDTRFQPQRQRMQRPGTRAQPTKSESFLRMKQDIRTAKRLSRNYGFS